MAEATGLRNNALPYPIYGVPFGVSFPLLDADGDPISPSSADSEISKNGDTFADCTNEATEIATSSGICYLLLTGTELTTDVATVRVQSTGAKTTVLTLYPRKLVSIRTGTSQAGAAGTITLDASASAVDDYYNGMVVVGVLDSATEARVITDYVGSTKVASVTPNWNTTPDADDTFTVYLPEGHQVQQSDLVAVAGITNSVTTAQLGVNVVNAAGTAWASGSLTSGVFAAGAITATAIATDAIGAAEIADGAITAATFAAGAIDATAIAANAIDAATFAADVDAEFLGYIVDDATRIDASALNTASVTTVPAIVADTSELQTDWADGGRLDLILDARASQTSVNTIDDFVDTEITALTTMLTGVVPLNGTIGATGNSTTVLHLDGIAWGDDGPNSMLILVQDVSAGIYVSRWITDFATAGDLATVATLPFTPEASVDKYWVLSPRADVSAVVAAADIRSAVGLASANLDTQLSTIDTNVDSILADTGTDGVVLANDAITAAKIAANAIGASEIADGAITAAKIATDAIDADAIAADAVTEIQSGLATAAALDAVDNFVDTEITTLITMLTGMVPANGTIGATGNSTTALHLAGLAYADDGINSMLLTIKDVSTGLFYSRWIEDWANTGDLATVATLPFTPEASVDLYWILPVRADVTGGSGLDAAGVRAAIGLASANLDTQLATIDTNVDDIETVVITNAAGVDIAADIIAIKAETASILTDTAEIGAAGAGLTNINLPNQTMDIVGSITGSLSGSVGSVTGAVGSIGAGGIAAASFAAGAIDAAAIATDAIGSDELAASAITEIQSGLSTLNAAGIRTAVGLASANLDTQLDALPTAAENADAVWDEDATAHQTTGTFGQAIGDPVADTNTIYKAVVTDAAGATVGIDVVAVKAETAAILDDTDDIGVAGAGLTAADDAVITAIAALNNLSSAQAQTAAAAALTAYDPPTRAEATTDANSILAVLPSALTGGGNIKADIIGISGDTTAADNLEAVMDATVASTVNDAAATTTGFVTALTEATNDHYNGRLLTFTSGALVGQQTAITDYVGSTKAVVVTALTEAPGNGDSFVIS